MLEIAEFLEVLLNLLCFIHLVAEEPYPCADYIAGEDDLQSIDYIRKFELDVNLDGYPGVSRVRGSTRLQTAYRINSNADLVMPT